MKTKVTYKVPITTLLLVCLAIILCAANCKKDNEPPKDKLPPATQTGENTFGCKIDGEVWEARLPYPFFLAGSSRLSVDPSVDGSFYVSARRRVIEEDPNEYINLRVSNSVFSEGEYLLEMPEGGGAYFMESTDPSISTCGWSSDSSSTGKLIITRYDMEEGIFSGKFYFTAKIYQGDCEETIEITEGRFDIKK